VLYHGPDAAAVTERWDQQRRPFDLRGLSAADDVLDALTEDDVDCLVCAGGEGRAGRRRRRRESVPGLQVVVFGRDGLDAATALEHGAAHFVDVGEDDPVETLDALRSVVDEHHTQHRDRTMLASLLENIPLSVYFKDCDSRHVEVSDEMPSTTANPYIEGPDGTRYHTPEDVVGLTDFDLYPAEQPKARRPTTGESSSPKSRSSTRSNTPTVRRSTARTSPRRRRRGTTSGATSSASSASRGTSANANSTNTGSNARTDGSNGSPASSATTCATPRGGPGPPPAAREDGDPDHFDAIERSLARMDELVEDVLRLARQGGTVTEPEAVAVATVARDAWNVVDSGDATLVVDADLVVMADPSRLAQLFENLFRNALEHAADRPDALTVTVADLRDARGFLVADDGIGIPEDEREGVFDAGFRRPTAAPDSGSTSSEPSPTPTAGTLRWPRATTAARASGSERPRHRGLIRAPNFCSSVAERTVWR